MLFRRPRFYDSNDPVLVCGGGFAGVEDLDGEDLKGLDGDGYGVGCEGQVWAFELLHEVRFDGVGGAGWDVEFDVGGGAGPLVHAEDEGVGVFGFLDGGEGDVFVFDAGEGVGGREAAGVREDLLGVEGIVQFVAAADGVGLPPEARVRVEGVGEVLRALVGVGVGPGGRAEERDAEGVAEGVVAVLGVVEDGEAGGGVAEIGPAEGGDFELGFLEAVVAGGGAFDGAVGDFVGGLVGGVGEGEGGFEEGVFFVPVDGVFDADGVGVGVEGDVLDEVRRLPGAGDADGLAERAVGEDGDGIDLVDDGGWGVEGAGVDVPGVVLLGGVFEGLELVGAGVGGEGSVFASEFEKACYAAGALVDTDDNKLVQSAGHTCRLFHLSGLIPLGCWFQLLLSC